MENVNSATGRKNPCVNDKTKFPCYVAFFVDQTNIQKWKSFVWGKNSLMVMSITCLGLSQGLFFRRGSAFFAFNRHYFQLRKFIWLSCWFSEIPWRSKLRKRCKDVLISNTLKVYCQISNILPPTRSKSALVQFQILSRAVS